MTSPEARRRQIVELVTDENGLSVEEISNRFDVSEPTIRRDLRELADRELIERTYGGALPATKVGSERSFDQRIVQGLDRKRAIGRRAVEEIHNGQVVFFNCGSTTLQIARQVPEDDEFVAVTNSPLIAIQFGGEENQIEVTGGSFRSESMGLVGSTAEEYVRSSNFDLAFIGTNGIDGEGTLTAPNEAEAGVKRAVIANTARSVVVSEVDKFGERTFRQFATLNDIEAVVTDHDIPDQFRELFEETDTEWLRGVEA